VRSQAKTHFETGTPGYDRSARALGGDAKTYRPDIDGLRALSILLVVGYHAIPMLVPGGFVGVDIFFVISGFLITGIILTEIDAGTFSPARFYARRVRRIFPALIVVLLVTYLIGWFVLLPEPYALLGRNLVASVAFASNLFQLGQTGYFAPDAAENPLLHLWSLGIEEQFYIFWPPVLLLIARSKHLGSYLLGIAAISFCACVIPDWGRAWSFYSPMSRAWELMVGGLIAERQLRLGYGLGVHFRGSDDLPAIVGAVLIGISAIGLSGESRYPGVLALLPTIGAALIIVSPKSCINRLLLARRSMVWIGLISYPLYLWHWPILSYLSILRNGVPNFLEICVAVAISVLLAWLTFRFIETPIRHGRNAVPRLVLGLAALGMAGIVTVTASGFESRFSPDILAIARLAPQNNIGLRNPCFVRALDTQLDTNCVEPGNAPLLFVWGDSTAAALYPGLENAEQRFSFRLAYLGEPGCAPILASVVATRCDKINAAAFGLIKSLHPDVVLLHAMWGKNNDLARLTDTIGQLKALKIPRIVILGPVPVWKRTLPHSIVNAYRLNGFAPDRIATGVSGQNVDLAMEAFSKSADVEYISAYQVFCNTEGCLTRVGPAAEGVVVTDIIHLSESGSQYLVDAIANRLLLRSATDNR
jgi:peptidoglycan/LPS O-acetylase OafA/YrhL